MSQRYDINTQPYCYGYDPKTNMEYLFGRDYRPIAKRKFLDDSSAEWIEAQPNHGQFSTNPCCRFGPFIEHEYSGWFYNDGNSPRYNKRTRRRMKEILAAFMSGEDIRDELYNIDRFIKFPDRTMSIRYKGIEGRTSAFA